jgi:hypothetical protein
MSEEPTQALAVLEMALAKVVLSGAYVHGEGTVWSVVGQGRRKMPARHDLDASDLYMGSGGKARVLPPEAPLWDFEGRQRRAIKGLEAALAGCRQAGLLLVGTGIGLLAVEQAKLASEDPGVLLEVLQDEAVGVEDSGAWR